MELNEYLKITLEVLTEELETIKKEVMTAKLI